MNVDKRVRLEPLLSFDRRSGTAASLTLLFALDGDLLGVFASLPGFSPQPLPEEDWRPRLTRAGSVFFSEADARRN